MASLPPQGGQSRGFPVKVPALGLCTPASNPGLLRRGLDCMGQKERGSDQLQDQLLLGSCLRTRHQGLLTPRGYLALPSAPPAAEVVVCQCWGSPVRRTCRLHCSAQISCCPPEACAGTTVLTFIPAPPCDPP